MARDDYHVIVYQILAYLYVQLKAGHDVDPKEIKPNSKHLGYVNEKYWNYIIYNMAQYHLIAGVGFAEVDGEQFPIPAQLDDIYITPDGIEYLCSNSLMEKAKRLLKGAVDIAPIILK